LNAADLTTRFAALADRADDGKWAEVVARAETLRRRRPSSSLALAAALALAVLLAAPAIGIRGRIVHLFANAEPAPQRVDRSLADLSGGATRGAVEVLHAPVGSNVDAVLWLAPIGSGGFCTKLDLVGRGGAGAECVALRPGKQLIVDVSIHGRTAPNGSVLGGPVLLDGRTSDPRAASLLLRFEDGETARIPLVLVGAPVETGFFVYGVPERHWRSKHLPTTLTLYAADGDELDRRDVHGIPPG
jgi:hypothetical protein